MIKRKPHSQNLRKGRHSQNNQSYLVTTVTYQRQPIFFDIQLGRIVVNAMRQRHEEGLVNSLAFVIMPDHMHWLFTLQNDCTLAKIMQLVKGSSSYQIQKLQREQGINFAPKQPLWQEAYHDHALRKEEELQQVARYIVANPLRAGIVKKVGDYPLWDAVWL